MSERLARGVIEIAIDDKDVRAGLARVTGASDSAAHSVAGISDGMRTSFGAVATVLGGAVTAIAGITTGIVALGIHGSDVADVQEAFSGLSEGMGSTADVMLGVLQEGTQGTISNFDLMKMSNAALGSGLITSSESMATLAAGAKLLADSTGGDTAEAFDTLTTAMASGRTAALKHLGIFVDSKVAVEDYRKSTGHLTGELTDGQRATALSEAALRALRKQVDENGISVKDFSDNVARVKVAVQNWTDSLAVAIAKSPVLSAGMGVLGTAITNAFGSNQQAQTQALARHVGSFAIGIVNTGIVLGTFASVANAVFSGVRVVVLSVLETFVVLATGIVGIINELVHGASTIPGFSLALGGVEASTTAATLALDEMAHGLTEQIGEAAKGVAGNNELGQKITATTGTFMLMRDAMVKAQTEQLKVTATAPHPAIKKVGDEAGLTAAQMLALAEAERTATDRAFAMNQTLEAKGQELQDNLTASTLSGVDARLFQINREREAALASLAQYARSYPVWYAAQVLAVQLTYGNMTAAAQGHFTTVKQAAEAAGFALRSTLQATSANATTLYADMLASGQFTYAQLVAAGQASANAQQLANGGTALTHDEQLRETARIAAEAYAAITRAAVASDAEIERAHRASADAQKAVDEAVLRARLGHAAMALDAASSMIGSIFSHNKSTAIAMALIDTASAIVKAIAATPLPWGLIPAAAAAAMGAAQIATIRNTNPGHALGTPRLDFADFGSESFQPLHNQEAVIPRGGGHLLAGEIADSMGGSAELGAKLDRIADLLERQPAEMRKAYRNAFLLDTA